jgi:hypothetical protein
MEDDKLKSIEKSVSDLTLVVAAQSAQIAALVKELHPDKEKSSAEKAAPGGLIDGSVAGASPPIIVPPPIKDVAVHGLDDKAVFGDDTTNKPKKLPEQRQERRQQFEQEQQDKRDAFQKSHPNVVVPHAGEKVEKAPADKPQQRDGPFLPPQKDIDKLREQKEAMDKIGPRPEEPKAEEDWIKQRREVRESVATAAGVQGIKVPKEQLPVTDPKVKELPGQQHQTEPTPERDDKSGVSLDAIKRGIDELKSQKAAENKPAAAPPAAPTETKAASGQATQPVVTPTVNNNIDQTAATPTVPPEPARKQETPKADQPPEPQGRDNCGAMLDKIMQAIAELKEKNAQTQPMQSKIEQPDIEKLLTDISTKVTTLVEKPSKSTYS